MISVYDLHKLSPEERRLHDLDHFVFNRMRLSRVKWDAQSLYDLWKDTFQYTLEEIQNAINNLNYGVK